MSVAFKAYAKLRSGAFLSARAAVLEARSGAEAKGRVAWLSLLSEFGVDIPKAWGPASILVQKIQYLPLIPAKAGTQIS